MTHACDMQGNDEAHKSTQTNYSILLLLSCVVAELRPYEKPGTNLKSVPPKLFITITNHN
jgi:hypothetical protein